MAKGGLFDVDDSQVKLMLNRLSGPEIKKAGLSALRSSAMILKKKTDENFQNTSVGKNMAIYRKTTVTKKSGKKVNKIRRIATVKVLKKDMIVKVHILSDYRVKWFETGTKRRHTEGYMYRNKKFEYFKGLRKYYKRKGRGRDTGSIKPEWFFRDAQRQTERPIFDNMEKLVTRAIIRIARKKK